MRYCFNKNSDNNNFHEVHRETCSYLPEIKDRVSLGDCQNDSTAIFLAGIKYPELNFDGCGHCMPGYSRG